MRLSWLPLVLLLPACGDGAAPTPVPSASPGTGVVPGTGSGPTRIVFVDATPAPGSHVSCGSDTRGCVGRIRLTFDLLPSATGQALWVVGFLHARSSRACLTARVDGFELRAGTPRRVTLAFDAADDCATPVEIATMAVVVEGTVEVASRQEFSLLYALDR